jgi:hypothetical protein
VGTFNGRSYSVFRYQGNRDSGAATVTVTGPSKMVPSSPFHFPGGNRIILLVTPFSRTGATRMLLPNRN